MAHTTTIIAPFHSAWLGLGHVCSARTRTVRLCFLLRNMAVGSDMAGLGVAKVPVKILTHCFPTLQMPMLEPVFSPLCLSVCQPFGIHSYIHFCKSLPVLPVCPTLAFVVLQGMIFPFSFLEFTPATL